MTGRTGRWVAGWLLGALLGGDLPAGATTLYPKAEQCPLCDSFFIITAVGSYFDRGMQERDFADGRFGWTRVWTCPYCLYSALPRDFSELTDGEKRDLQQLMPTPRLRVSELEAAELRKQMGFSFGDGYAGLLLARQFYARRGLDARSECDLSLLLYYAAWHAERPLVKAYADAVVAPLSNALARGVFDDQKGGVHAMTYLVGEMCRRAGRSDEALDWFAKAQRQAGSGPSTGGFGNWAYEQTCRIQLATGTTERLAAILRGQAPRDRDDESRPAITWRVAAETLADRSVPAAWRALGDFAMEDPERLLTLRQVVFLPVEKLGLYPEFLAHVGMVYSNALRETNANQLPEDALCSRIVKWFKHNFGDGPAGGELDAARLAIALQAAPPPEPDGNSGARAVEAGGGGPPQAPEMPLGWPVDRVLESLPDLVAKGDTNAIDFLLRWCASDGPRQLGRELWRSARAIVALGAHTNAWKLPPPMDPSAAPIRRLIRLCLGVLQAEPGAGPQLYALVMNTNLTGQGPDVVAKSPESLMNFNLHSGSEAAQALAFRCLATAHDASVKTEVLGRLRTESTGDFARAALSYLEVVATPADLSILDEIAQAAYEVKRVTGRFADDQASDRRIIEESIRRIRIRRVLENCFVEGRRVEAD